MLKQTSCNCFKVNHCSYSVCAFIDLCHYAVFTVIHVTVIQRIRVVIHTFISRNCFFFQLSVLDFILLRSIRVIFAVYSCNCVMQVRHDVVPFGSNTGCCCCVTVHTVLYALFHFTDYHIGMIHKVAVHRYAVVICA